MLSTGCGQHDPTTAEMYLDAMPRRARRTRDSEAADRWELNVNQIVAYNIRAARQLKEMTQATLALRLTAVSGLRFTPGMVSELERSWDGERHREFDAHEIAVFAVALKVPIAYFFLPPPDEHRDLEGMGRSARELHLLLLGYFDTVEILDERMREFAGEVPPEYEEAIANLPSGVGPWSYKKRRKELIMALLDGMADEVDKAFDTIREFADLGCQTGIRGFIAEQANDPDFAVPPENRVSVSGETDETSGSPASEPADGPPADGPPADDTSASLEPASTARRTR